ncbi:hypothetical protein BDF21DRAFT_402324 [Thamnidium elegans]|nr:hypothetical protein BDF21DRAFT_402324 [Thamnidium elegans]
MVAHDFVFLFFFSYRYSLISQKKKEEEENDIEKVNVSGSRADVSNRRLSKLKGRLKWMLYTHKEKSTSKRDFDLADITNKEMHEEINLIPAQLPLLVLSNKFFEISDYTRYSIKLCPRPSPSSLLCLPVDAAMLYMLMTSFDDNPFDIFCKDVKVITSLPTAIKNKTVFFGSIFDNKRIKTYCNSRRLSFIHRVLIRSGLITGVINDSSIKKYSNPLPSHTQNLLKSPT